MIKRTMTLKGGLEALGFNVKKWNDGYNYRSGFAEKDGQLYYFMTGDLRLDNYAIIYRKAKNMSDHTGGANMDLDDLAREKGIELYENRKKCDYNRG